MSRKIDPKKIDEVFADFELPTDEEIREQTRRVKISNSTTGIPASQVTKDKIKNAYSTDDMRAVQASKSKPHTDETKEKIREAFVGKSRPPEVVEKIKAKRKGRAVYHKPFVTPSGAFLSKKSAIEWATDNGVRNASGKFDKWIKTCSDEFYYIAADEYEKIKDEPKKIGLEWMSNARKKRKI